MKPIDRSEILDYQTYSDQRDALLPSILEAKRQRRIHVGPYLTFLFENRETIRYQIHEMLRVERIVREADIQHEIETYNELIGQNGQLCATLLIEIEDTAVRDRLLRQWLDLPSHLFAVMSDGRRINPIFDGRQSDGERLSSVQFITFPFEGEAPARLVCDLEGPAGETDLEDSQKAALAADLAGS